MSKTTSEELQFILWLKRNHLYAAFSENVERAWGSVPNGFFWHCTDELCFVSEAFRWKDTRQGKAYWESVNKAWTKYLREQADKVKEAFSTSNTPSDEEGDVAGEASLGAFSKFLASHACLDAFISELQAHRGLNLKDYYHEVEDGYHLILEAFAWEDTPQGNNFWSHIDNLWYGYCNRV